MGVDRMRATKIAPDALSTSYLTGSAAFGISMTTLISSGGVAPVGTRSRPMGVGCSGCCGGGGYSTRCGAANENGGPGAAVFPHPGPLPQAGEGVVKAAAPAAGPRC